MHQQATHRQMLIGFVSGTGSLATAGGGEFTDVTGGVSNDANSSDPANDSEGLGSTGTYFSAHHMAVRYT